MKKAILLSGATILAVAAVVAGATTAFFTDTETSTGNTFTAGSLDLKVDSMCHYWHYTGVGDTDKDPENGMEGWVDMGCRDGEHEWGNWTETDLGPEHKFFWIRDLKPGDWGENTISLHVYDNDAWGKIMHTNTGDMDNSCTEPETEAEPLCTPTGDGELDNYMLFSVWLDQGMMPGFQNGNKQPGGPDFDRFEGDNIWQEGDEPQIQLGSELELATVLSAARQSQLCLGMPSNGHNNYGMCHGLADDGRMVESVTYYFGFEWHLPWWVGNDVQTDSLMGDLGFMVEQWRNNPNPF